jgi:hypothetical protein
VSEQLENGGSSGTSGLLVRLREIASFIAPTTLATALLFYFGYVATRSRFEYFGVYLDMTDLSNQNLLLYGIEVVYVPAALAFLTVLLIVAVHGTVSWLVSRPERDSLTLLLSLAAALGGLLLVGRALLGMFRPSIEETEPVPGTTALALAVGPALIAYAAWIAGRVSSRKLADEGGRARGSVRFAAWSASAGAARFRHGAVACVIGLAVAGLFWAANEFAWAYGAGKAYDDATKMWKRPPVILETKEQLAGPPPGIEETVLPPAAAAEGADAFRYRYQGLRLLLTSGGRLYLVPQQWTEGSRTTVVTYNEDVRVQLLPASE